MNLKFRKGRSFTTRKGLACKASLRVTELCSEYQNTFNQWNLENC